MLHDGLFGRTCCDLSMIWKVAQFKKALPGHIFRVDSIDVSAGLGEQCGRAGSRLYQDLRQNLVGQTKQAGLYRQLTSPTRLQ